MRQKALEGLRKFQEAERRPPVSESTPYATCGDAKLLHPGAQSGAAKTPVVLIASLVNSHQILDLADQKSLSRFLSAQGHDPWLIDWGQPETEGGGIDLAGHIEKRLLPLLKKLDRPPILVGYCLGGTIALAAAQQLPVAGIATIAAPWHFDRFPKQDSALIAKLWQDAKALCEQLGYVPMEVMQTGFWALDPNRTIRKYATFADFPEESPQREAFIAVEDWANEGAPLTFNAGRNLFERFYAENDPGGGRWRVGGTVARPEKLQCPSLSIASSTDRIVPANASLRLKEHIESRLGHVGMIVSSRAPEQIWQPLSQWLSRHGA